MPDTSCEHSPPPVPGQTGRYLFVLLLGLLLGVIGMVMALRAIESGKTWQDRYPIAVMRLMSAHSAQLGQQAAANHCMPADVTLHLQALRMLGDDLEPAFAELGSDRRFMAHAGEFRGQLERILADPPDHCASLERTRAAIGGACKACHQDFR